MARIRTIKPEFWTSEQVMDCDPIARLLFIGIWNFCDDAGNHPASEKTIKAQVFPGDDVDSKSIRRMLDELSANGLLSFYESSCKRYLHVNGWRHQKIDKPTIKHPPFPGNELPGYVPEVRDEADDNEGMRSATTGVPEASPSIRLVVDESSDTSRRGLTPGREGEGIGSGREETSLVPSADVTTGDDMYSVGFLAFWNAYPKRDRSSPKKPAWKAWKARTKSGVNQMLLITAAHAYSAEMIAKGKVGTEYVMQPATFLGPDERWIPYTGKQPVIVTAQSSHVNLNDIDHESGLVRNDDGSYRIASTTP